MEPRYGQSSMPDRMMRAARLDSQVYEEVEHDQTATSQALTVVVVAAVAAGLGQALGALGDSSLGNPIGLLIAGIVGSLLGWAAWSGIAYFIGTRVFNGVATYGELLRTIGFAQAPGVLRIFAFIPLVGTLINVAVFFWILAATVVAMRQALDVDTTKAVLTGVLGIVAYAIISFLIALPFAAAAVLR